VVRSRVSRGGQANEAGSLYRSGVAAYLAAHGLAGRAVEAAGYLEGGPVPVTLAFETGQAVDDIRCGLADRTVLDLQAKRACGADKYLTATVAQWAAQAGQLGPGDRIGLATAEPRGPVRHLGGALRRRRRPVPGTLPPREANAVKEVRARVPAGMGTVATERMLDAAIVMNVAVSTAGDEGFRSAANLLEGVVVGVGSGTKAMTALQRAFQEQASEGAGSGLDEWLQILAGAGILVFSDAGGRAGPRRRAELDAVAAYRARLAARDGVLEYPLLAEDLPPMKYSRLADSLCVTVPGLERIVPDDFLPVARRWPRMLLTGLPGMGKSTALEQAAARWAADPAAPVPVLLQLRDLARRDPRRSTDITLPVLIQVATDSAPEHERMPLRTALEKVVACGEAVLLLDGLDECQDRRGVVSDGLAAVAAGLPPGTGMVLATRDSGLAAAGKLNMPRALLAEPRWLEPMLTQLLRHAAAARQVPPDEQDHWVGGRRQQVDQIRVSHPDLWRVPLLATLLTLLAASREPGTLPSSRAQLMAEVVQHTVHRWELTRQRQDAPGLSGEQLIDGYSEIAHAIAARPGGSPEASVQQQVAAMLADQWGRAPAEARALARHIMAFWDEQTGVFVAFSPAGDIEPRSRVFVETGDAMWAARQEPGARREWIAAALADDDRREAVLLAAGLAPDVITYLVESAAAGAASTAARSRALEWAADAAAETPGPAAAGALRALIRELAGAALNAVATPELPGTKAGSVGQLRADVTSPGWRYARRIAMLRLPAELRAERDHALDELELDDSQQAIAQALAALADAAADSRDTLGPGQEAAVRRLLALPLPEHQPAAPAVFGPGTGPAARTRARPLPGHVQAAEQAVRYAVQFGPSAASAFYRISRRGSVRQGWRIREQLIALGYEDPDPPRASLNSDGISFADLTEHFWDDWEILLEAAATIAPPRPLTHSERWRYPDIAQLADVLDVENASLDGINDALSTDPAFLALWLRAVAHAAGLDLPGISAQAQAALQSWAAGNRDIMEVIFAPQPAPAPRSDPTRLDPADATLLIEALGATSEWLAESAYEILVAARDPGLGSRVAAVLAQMAAGRRKNAAIVAIANDTDPPGAARRFQDRDDPALRSAAAAAAAMLAGQGGDPGLWTPVLARAGDEQAAAGQVSAETGG
jgi:hypothetical protein